MKKKRFLFIVACIIALMLFSVGCSLDGSGTVIDIAAIPGITAPAGGEEPVTSITETDQYTGTVSWSPDDDPFAYETVYTATITLTAKEEYTLTGVEENFFTVDGADTVTHDAGSGVVTAVFPITAAAVYDIGDTGPAGGIIFYVDTADNYTWTYLEVAPQSTEWEDKIWGDQGTEIGGDAALTGIGDGQAATTAIVSHMEGQQISGTAAQLCDGLEHDHDGTTYKDWFLPSKDELNAIWENIVDDGSGSNSGVGGFADSQGYWSSSEDDNDNAWWQYFGSFLQDSGLKDNTAWVRAVRAF